MKNNILKTSGTILAIKFLPRMSIRKIGLWYN